MSGLDTEGYFRVISKQAKSLARSIRRSTISLVQSNLSPLRSCAEGSRVPDEVLLHIGLAKTGTTSIQQFCVENTAKLLDCGMLYPQTGQHGPGHQMLGLASLAADQRTADIVDRTPVGQAQLFDQIATEFERTGPSVRSILLSSERFGAMDLEAIERLRSLLPGIRVRPIVYLRRQDLMAESLFAQGMRVRGKARNDRPLNPGRAQFPVLRFRVLIERWASVFGRENMIVRKFEKRPDGKDVVADFLEAIGATEIERGDRSYHLNTKLSRDALEYLYFHTDLVYDSPEYESVQRKLIEYSRRQPTPIEHRNFYSPKQRIAVLKNHEADNRIVAREYFGEETLFSGKLPTLDDPWESYPGLSTSTLKMISDFVESYQLPRRKRTLESRVRNGIKSIGAMDWMRRSA